MFDKKEVSQLKTPDDQPCVMTDTALCSTSSIAFIGITTLTMLETLLPAVAEESARANNDLTDSFMTLINYMNAISDPPPHIQEAIANIVTNMQSQDRESQIIESVTSILEKYRKILENLSTDIEGKRKDQDLKVLDISSAIEEILSDVHFTDIRAGYLRALNRIQTHLKGIKEHNTCSENKNGSIELF